MTRNNTVIGIVVAMTVAVIITGSTLPMVFSQQNGNMTGVGGELRYRRCYQQVSKQK